MLKNKRVLITAGPTWVAIDKVRIISNIATGETGILLARQLSKKGARVTLLLGPVETFVESGKEIRVLRFKYFNELEDKLSSELARIKYDVVIHSAAVADYKPNKKRQGKIDSNLGQLRIELVPNKKIIDSIKIVSPKTFVVGFKFEPNAIKTRLIREAIALIRRSGIDLVVANSVVAGKYSAYFVDKGGGVSGPASSKNQVAVKLRQLLI